VAETDNKIVALHTWGLFWGSHGKCVSVSFAHYARDEGSSRFPSSSQNRDRPQLSVTQLGEYIPTARRKGGYAGWLHQNKIVRETCDGWKGHEPRSTKSTPVLNSLAMMPSGALRAGGRCVDGSESSYFNDSRFSTDPVGTVAVSRLDGIRVVPT
jgi:hypothetical protein